MAFDSPGFLMPTYDENIFLAGCSLYSDSGSTVVKAILRVSKTIGDGNRGIFITPQIPCSEIEDNWQTFWAKFKNFQDANDEIVVKYRINKNSNLPFRAGVAWTDGNTFTSTSSDFQYAAVGDEVEVIVGKGGGTTAHITAISLNGSTYTVDIDETITGAAGNAIVRVQNWTKFASITGTTLRNFVRSIGKKSQWIQFKFELRGDLSTGGRSGPEIEELQVVSGTEQVADIGGSA